MARNGYNYNTNSYQSDESYLVQHNMFWADYGKFLTRNAKDSLPAPKIVQPPKPTNKMTCKNGHPIICWGTHAKPRKDENG